jgi:Stage II sporulation protein E (SpoIIE)
MEHPMWLKKPGRRSFRPPWGSAPAWTIATFLAAVFFVFASFGFVQDDMNMGRQPILRLAFSVVVIGLFSAIYAMTGIQLRQWFWIAFIPIFFLQNVCMALLNHWLPAGAALTQLNSAQLAAFQGRLTFDGRATMISVVLGYVGFVVVSISEARRHIRLELDKAAVDSELAAAREIQGLMVPEKLPAAPGYTIESIYRPAAQVGGDFFQVIQLRGGQTLVVVGDVSGKGISAAMIVSMIIGMLSTLTTTFDDPSEILTELNSRLIGRQHGGFVTCLAAVFYPSGRVVLANAGHLAPWLNSSEVAFKGSIPLSLLDSEVPEEVILELRPGDRLTLFTDGVVEARDADGALFGFDRIGALMREGQPLHAIAGAAVHHGQDDDLTVISIQRQA